jgi:hypothetical protein
MIKQSIALLCFLLSLPLHATQPTKEEGANSSVNPHTNHAINSSDVPASHGMTLFGTNKIYAYHIADFAPHNYQIILELDLDEAAHRGFLEYQASHPSEATYTIEPEYFILPDMINNPRPFKVKLYQGNFTNGKGGTLIDQTTVRIKNVIYFKKFDPKEPKPNTTEFILFGNEKEQFIAHYLTAKPDFDQVIQVKANTNLLNDNSFQLLLANQRTNTPLSVSGNIIGTRLLTPQHKNQNKTVQITLSKQIYSELDYINKYYDLLKNPNPPYKK